MSVSMVDMAGGFVLVLRFLGLIVFFGLLLALHNLGKYATAHISFMAALESLSMSFSTTLCFSAYLMR